MCSLFMYWHVLDRTVPIQKKRDCLNREITCLMLLTTLENYWQVFKFHLALYKWGQIALSLDFCS